LAETLSLAFILNSARNAHMVHRRHENKVSAGQCYMSRYSGPLAPDRLLGDLHEDVLSLLKPVLYGDAVIALAKIQSTVFPAAIFRILIFFFIPGFVFAG